MLKKTNRQMEIIILPKGMSEELANDNIENIENSYWDDVQKDLKSIDPNYSFKEINLGTGADWIVIMATVIATSNIFLLGDKINTGIDGWIKIAKRIKSIFQKSDRVLLDSNSAKIYGLQDIAEKIKIESVRIENENEIVLSNLSGMLLDRKETDFIAKPWSIYIFTYIINEKQRVILSVRSDGKIIEILNNELSEYLPF
jgi:hypothetical protein